MTPIYMQDAVGKTVTAVEGDDYTGLLIVFSDGTYSVVMASQEYDSVYLRNGLRAPMELRYDFSQEALIRLGILTQAEIDAEDARKAAERRAQNEAQERMLFERLRAKYGE